MNKIKKGLGRGLSSLIGETKIEPKTNKLLLSDIVPNKFQPRKNFNEENFENEKKINSNKVLYFKKVVTLSDQEKNKHDQYLKTSLKKNFFN